MIHSAFVFSMLAASVVGQVVAPTEPASELIKLALNAGITGIFGLYVYWNSRQTEIKDEKRDGKYEELVQRIEKIEERRIDAEKIARAELISTLREIQGENRTRSENDRALVRDVVQVMTEVKRAVELQADAVRSQEKAVTSLDGMFRSMQAEFQRLQSMITPTRQP